MKGKLLLRVFAGIYILVFAVIVHIYLFQNHFIFIVTFQGYNETNGIKKHTFKNNMGKYTNIYVKEKGFDDNAIYFNCMGQNKRDFRFIYETKFLNHNFIFLLHRGHEKDQFIRNKKLINSDIQVAGDFLMQKTAKGSKITISGHSLGCYSAIRCAEYVNSKGRECILKIVDPFFSIKTHLESSLFFAAPLLCYSWSNENGLEKLGSLTTVYLAEFENNLPKKEAQRVREFLIKNNIKIVELKGKNHMETMFIQRDIFRD